MELRKFHIFRNFKHLGLHIVCITFVLIFAYHLCHFLYPYWFTFSLLSLNLCWLILRPSLDWWYTIPEQLPTSSSKQLLFSTGLLNFEIIDTSSLWSEDICVYIGCFAQSGYFFVNRTRYPLLTLRFSTDLTNFEHFLSDLII